MSYYTSYYTTFLTYAWVHTLILLRFTILYMQHRIYVGGVWLAITEHLSLLEALGHCQQHIICLSLLIDIHQDQCDEDHDGCDDNEYHCSIAWGPCNRWPSKFAAYNVSVVPAPAQSTIDCTLLIRVVGTKFARPTIVCSTYNKSVPSLIHRVIWQNLLLPSLYCALTVNLSFSILPWMNLCVLQWLCSLLE